MRKVQTIVEFEKDVASIEASILEACELLGVDPITGKAAWS